MDTLQILVDLVKDLPDMALWVILGFFIYKIIIVGSLYGTVKFGLQKLHDMVVFYKTPKPEVKEIDILSKINEITITAEVDFLISQLRRLIGRRTTIYKDSLHLPRGCYIHQADIKWLEEAITEKAARDREATNG